MGIVDRVLQCQRRLVINYNPMRRRRRRHISSEAKRVVRSPCLLLPPGLGFQINDGKKISLFFLPTKELQVEKEKEKQRRALGYRHFLDLGTDIPRGIRDIEINTRTIMWRGRYVSPEKGLAECVGSSQGLAAFLDRETCDFYLFNFWINPNNNTCFFPNYLPLPPIETLPTILTRETFLTTPDRNDISSAADDIPISETKFLLQTYNDADPVSSEQLSENFIKRLALSWAPTPLFDHDDKEEEEEPPMVMIIHGYKELQGQLAFCRLGDAAWTSLHHNSTTCFPYEDITYFSPHGKFYALTKSQNLEAWDLTNIDLPKVKLLKTHGIVPKRDESCGSQRENLDRRKMYLVESEGKLLMVISYYNCKTVLFDVFVLTMEQFGCWEWMKITNLNGRTLFVGPNVDSVSIPYNVFPELIPNSIYFTHFYGEEEEEDRGDVIVGVYDLKLDESIYWFNNDRISPCPPTWIFPSI